MLRSPRLWLGFAVSALFVVLLLRQVDPGELADAVRGVRPAWLLAAGAVYLAGLWLRSLRWWLVLRPSLAISIRDTFVLVVIGSAANNLLPARAGELVRAGLLQQRHGGSWMLGLGTIALERVLDGIVLTVFLATTIALAGGSTLLRGLALFAGAVFVAITPLIVLLIARPEATTAMVVRLPRLLPAALRPRARAWLNGFLGGLTTLRGPAAWSRVVAVTVVSWAFEAAAYWLVGVAFGLDVSPPLYLGVAAATNLAIAVPSTVGGIGPFEFFARETVVAYGAATTLATAYAIVLHALLLIPVVVAGLLLLWQRHIGLRAFATARKPTAAGSTHDG